MLIASIILKYLRQAVDNDGAVWQVFEIEIPDGALDASITLGYFTAIHTSDFILKWIYTLHKSQILRH